MKNKKVMIPALLILVVAVAVGAYFVFRTKDYPVTIQKIDVTKSPDTIVSLSPLVTSILTSAGYGDKLSGVSDYCNISTHTNPEKPRLGSGQHPDVGKILEIKPTLILTQTPMSNTVRNEIEKNNIPIILMENPISMESTEQFYYDVLSIFEGRNVGKKKNKDIFGKYQEKIKEITGKVTVPEKQTFGMIGSGGVISTYDTIESTLFSKLFGKNAGGEKKNFEITAEELIQANPDVLLVKKGTNLSAYGEVSAVKNQKVYEIEFVGFEQSNLQLMLQDLEEVKQKAFPS